jgi:predicted DNA-binding transcriptional regulator AlpA
MNFALLRLPAVLHARGRSRSSHYDDIKSLLHNLPFGPDWSDFQHLRTT